MKRTSRQALALVRKLCTSLPDVTERLSHGAEAWFTGKRQFCAFANNHHNDGRLSVWCASDPGAQQLLVDANPQRFFVPPYVGPSGWVGVILDDIPEKELARVLTAAHATIVAKQLAQKRKKRAPK